MSLRHAVLPPCKTAKQNTHYFHPPSWRLFVHALRSQNNECSVHLRSLPRKKAGAPAGSSGKSGCFSLDDKQVNRMYVIWRSGLQPRRLLTITRILFNGAHTDVRGMCRNRRRQGKRFLQLENGFSNAREQRNKKLGSTCKLRRSFACRLTFFFYMTEKELM